MKLENIFTSLGVPLMLIGVIVALLKWAGLTLEQLYVVSVALVGVQLFGSFLVDVLKYIGVITPGSSGKWSAVYNLVTLIGIVYWLKVVPGFDIYTADAQLYEFAKVLGLVFTYITQVLGTKAVHQFTVKNLGINVFTFAKGNA